MAFTSADLEAIDRAIARGERTVQFSDRSVSYRSMEELLQARAVIAREVAGTTRTRTGLAGTGLE